MCFLLTFVELFEIMLQHCSRQTQKVERMAANDILFIRSLYCIHKKWALTYGPKARKLDSPKEGLLWGLGAILGPCQNINRSWVDEKNPAPSTRKYITRAWKNIGLGS